MSIEPRGNGWRVRWRAGGSHHSRTFPDKATAKEFDRKMQRAKALGGLSRFTAEVEGGQQPLSQVFDEWATTKHVAPKTERLYLYLANTLILPYLGNEPIGSITTRDVELWLSTVNTGPVAKAKAVGLLGQVFNAARRWGYVSENPAALAERPRKPQKKAVRPPVPEDAERIRAWLLDGAPHMGKKGGRGANEEVEIRTDPRHGEACLVSVLYMAGLRPIEARNLEWSDVRDRTLWIDATKTGNSRAVTICGPLAADLAAWKLASGGTGYVFPNSRGELWSESGWSNWRKRIWAKAPGNISRPYDLRHTCASLLIREGMSITEVAKQMGHSAEECLRTYAHVFADLDPQDRSDRETLIRRARAKVFGSDEMEATG